MENKITIEFAHICENVIVAQNGNLSIINIFNQINAKSFPAIHSNLTVVVGAGGEEGEYEVNIQIINTQDYKLISSLKAPIKMKIPKSPAQGRLFVNFSPLVIPSDGYYEINISIGGQTKKLYFQVKRVE